MYFKKLELFGFKSFADKTVLNFGPGISAVVGPNGCGKSNIFDSIRWVLGEQSAKELRGSAMEDVIFNGTDKKAALGFAEVSLTFSNENKIFPVDYDEVTITRRLFRSGESEYLLNKTPVRLKDILDLYMGTGIGAEAYSIIQQGKVDMIVSARPEDRRYIIDEAAGITRYKTKKREAINKLKDTENNLLRINDIIIEVKRQIGSIERQANKARRYKEEFEKLKDLELKLACYELNHFQVDHAQLNELLGILKTQLETFTRELEDLNGQLGEQNEAISDIDQKIGQVHSEDLRLENQTAMDRRQISFNEERIQELTSLDARFDEQAQHLETKSQSQKEKITTCQASLAALKDSVQKCLETLEVKRARLNDIAREIHDTKATIKKNEEGILQLTTEQVGMKNEFTEVMKEFQGYLARKHRLELENEKVLTEKDEVDHRLKSICEDIEGCQIKINDLKGQKGIKENIVGELKQARSVVEQTLDDLEKKRLFLCSQKQFIEELRVQYQDIPDPVIEGTLLTTHAPQSNNQGIIGKVKEFQQIAPEKYEALKARYPHLSGNLYEIVCEAKFIELDPQLIEGKIEEFSQKIQVESANRERLLTQISEQENVIQSILSAIHDQEKVLSIYEAQKNDVLGEVNKLSEELKVVETEIFESRDAMATLKAREEELAHRLDLINRETQRLQLDIRDRQEAITLCSQEREEITVSIAQMETELQSAQDKEKSHNENLAMFEEELATCLAGIQKIAEEKTRNQIRKHELEQEILSLNTKIEEVMTKREALKESLIGYEQQKSVLLEQVSIIRRNMKEKESQMEEIKTSLHQQDLKVQETAFAERSLRDRLMQTYKIDIEDILRRSKNPSVSSPVDASVPPEGVLPQEQIILETISADQQAEMPNPEAPAPVPTTPPVSIDWSAIETLNQDETTLEIERLRKRCESFGAVNLVAIEEYEQLKQRFEFLTKQQADLLEAKSSLESTISKINRTTRQLFLDTFTKVSEEFRIYFRMLFGGGEADLILVDPDNVLESGIEIIARPPGKKLQNITLLSGGEKTLAAIALIFGIFKVRPSPFCILDEIDAALDESNVGRFGYLLKDFSKIAQFIVITHNKRTIANANVMYGITMQETGVSKIVSVKFGEEESSTANQEEIPAAV